MACPPHSFIYNGSLCACNPGYLLNRTANACDLFSAEAPSIQLSSGVDYGSAFTFPGAIFSFDSIKKFTQSQAVFLEATLVMLLCWLAFCLLLRFFPLPSDGRSALFKTRWWISRLDVTFATRHWLDDHHPVVKRKTELGGAFSIASWILFIGLFAAEVSQLQASLQNSGDGLINTTLVVNFLSSYIVEIDNQNILGPVSFLADLGGLYCISIGIFFCFLVQCEYRITRLRYEDTIMKNIRNRRKAQDRWDKLRKYVRFTWGSCSLDDSRSEQTTASCTDVMTKSFHHSESSRKRRLQDRSTVLSFSKKVTPPDGKKVETENNSQEVRSCSNGASNNLEGPSSFSICKPEEPFDGSLESKSHEDSSEARKSKKAAQPMDHALAKKKSFSVVQ